MAIHLDRVVVLVDMDCFYCQVEEKLNTTLAGKPIAVAQYKAWRGGGLIAVNYPARDKGVTRHMRGDEAKEKCPEIELIRVPEVRGKADLSKYREAGKRVADVLKTFTNLLQRASVDEAYLDITEAVNNRIAQLKNTIIHENVPYTFVVGCDTKKFIQAIYSHDINQEHNMKLLVGSVIVEEIRAAIYKQTGYTSSAGIAHNKILAKLACGMNKPNKQTILPHDSIDELYKTLSIKKIKSLGGKFGHTLAEELNIKYMSELAKFSDKELMKKYDQKTSIWLYNIARGIDTEPVEIRLISKSIGCCKRFPGKNALTKLKDVRHWLSELSEEIAERLDQDLKENNRKAKQIVISFSQEVQKKDVHNSRSQILNSYETRRILEDSLETLKRYTQKPDGSFHIKFLGLSAGKFDNVTNISDISTLFKQINQKVLKKDKTESELKKQINITKNIQKNLESFLKTGSTSNKNMNENVFSKSQSEGKIKQKQNSFVNFFNNQAKYNKNCNKSDPENDCNESDHNHLFKDNSNYNQKLNVQIKVNSKSGFREQVEQMMSTNKVNDVPFATVSFGENYLVTKQYIPHMSKTNEEHESGLSITDIEKDANDSFDFIKCGNKQIDTIETDNLSTSTIEMDFTEILKNKQDYPYHTAINDNFYNENSYISGEPLKDMNYFREMSPILEQTTHQNNGSSFLKRYFKEFATLTPPIDNITNNKEFTITNNKRNNYTNYGEQQTIPQYQEKTHSHYESDGSNYSITDLSQYDNEQITKNLYNENSVNKVNDNVYHNEESIDRLNANNETSIKKKTLCELCDECQQNIPISLLTSHMDEHMAFKLMEEEKTLFQKELATFKQSKLVEAAAKQVKKSPQKQKSLKPTKQIKRKLANPDNNLSISLFFKKNPEQIDNDSKLCVKCHKQIKLTELASHLDFHVAKKLHFQLNPVQTTHNNNFSVHSINKENDTKRGNAKNNTNQAQIFCNFFKNA